MAQVIKVISGAPLESGVYTFSGASAVKLTAMGVELPTSPSAFTKVTLIAERGSFKLHFGSAGDGATFPEGSIIELDQYAQVQQAYLTGTANNKVAIYSEV